MIVDRATAATLYLDLVIPWESDFKSAKGSFSVRSKLFADFRKENQLQLIVEDSAVKTNATILQYEKEVSEKECLIVTEKGGKSILYSIFRHLRNAVCHGHVKLIKVKRRNYLVFKAYNTKSELVMLTIIPAKLLKPLLSAIKHSYKEKSVGNEPL